MSFLVVDRHNLSSLSLSIKHSIQNATFVSIDTEFTGLGQNKKTRAQNVEDRYAALKSVACSHSVIGVGMSVFTAVPPTTDDDEDGNGDDGYSQNDHNGKKRSLGRDRGEEEKRRKKKCDYRVENFDFRLLSLADHVVSPASLTFLVQHGFDFNDQYLNGIPYYPGDLPPDSLQSTAGQKEDLAPSISARNIKNLECNTIFRGIIMDVLLKKCPIVLHNGLLDLIFLYQSFYAQLPPTLPVFIADCSEIFHGAGVFDTKYISDFMTRESASFLSLLFRKYQRAQSTREANGESFVNITFKDPVSFKPIVNPAKLHELGLAPNVSSKSSSGSKNSKKAPIAKPYCEQYANHGFCVDGKTCLLSHDLDIILDDKVGPLPPAAKKLKPYPSTSPSTSSKKTTATSQMGNLFERDHSACYDAFMTGYVFAHQMMTEPNVLQEARNKIYLIGKQIPLLIEQSKYAKPSTSHLAIRQKYKL